ncbi:class I SAM-dependent methyltransferase [Patescibacteria group bacterium]|nr:class I SAM-dependent methyltransferase [Patescibacteria group bacterium]
MNHTGNQMVDPYLLFQKAQLQAGMHIADFGCGRTNHIVFPASPIIGDRGVVYAVDVMKNILENVKKNASISALHNIHPIWADLEKIGKTAIPDSSIDVGFLVNVLDQSNNRHAILEEIHRLLKDKARLVVVDWYKKGLKFGPDDARFVDFEDIKRWSGLHGYALQEEFDVGPYHKGVVLYKI